MLLLLLLLAGALGFIAFATGHLSGVGGLALLFAVIGCIAVPVVLPVGFLHVGGRALGPERQE